MTAAKVGGPWPAGSTVYNDGFEGQSGEYSELWSSTLTNFDNALQEVLDAALQLGTSYAVPPFSKTIIKGRTITPADVDETQLFRLSYTLGNRSRKQVLTAADWTFSFSSSLSSAQTNVDVDDNFITVGTIAGDPLTPAVPTATAVPKTGAQVEKMFPSIRITATGQLTSNPYSSFQSMVGKLNSVAMTIDGQSMAIGTTMLVGANVSTPNDGDFYNVDYEYEYREDPLDWFAVVVAIDPKTGKPYEGITGTFYNTAGGTTKGTITVLAGSIGYEMYGQANIGLLIA